MPEPKNVLRETDAQAIRLAKTLVRSARYGALATIDSRSGAPIASRVGVSTDIDGTPIILISGLAPHTAALRADPRCSLLLGEPGKGDPLAHARISLDCRALEIERDTATHQRLEGRYLRHQPKAALYAGLGDFRFFRLEVQGASLNGGFGRAYALEAGDVLTRSEANEALAEMETGAVEHMNDDHGEAVSLYAQFFAKAQPGKWTLVGIDAEGVDIAEGDQMLRVFFEVPLVSAGEMRPALVAMAQRARAALAG
ncbi:MAG TPA: HugZ family protein [Devosiaceae bacterium]|jgi:hypothetical protein